MTEAWMYAIPLTIAATGFFHFLLADLFTSVQSNRGLVISWMFFAFLLILDAAIAVHLIAQDTTSADLTTPTRVAYLLVLGSMIWSALLLIVDAVRGGGEQIIESAGRLGK